MPQQPEDDVDASPSYSPMDLHEETPVRERRAPANPLSWIVVVIILLVLLSVLTSVYN